MIGNNAESVAPSIYWCHSFHQLISQRLSGERLELGSFLEGTEDWTEKRGVKIEDVVCLRLGQ